MAIGQASSSTCSQQHTDPACRAPRHPVHTQHTDLHHACRCRSSSIAGSSASARGSGAGGRGRPPPQPFLRAMAFPRHMAQNKLLALITTMLHICPTKAQAPLSPVPFVDAGSGTLCVDQATMLPGPGLSDIPNVAGSSMGGTGCAPHQKDCVEWCQGMPGCTAVVEYSGKDATQCAPGFDTVASCINASRGGSSGKVDSLFWAACCVLGGVGSPEVVQYTAIHGKDPYWPGDFDNTCHYRYSPPTSQCAKVAAATAQWVAIETLGVAKDVTYTYGVKHSYSTSTTSQWAASASASVTAGFKFLGIGTASATVSGSVSASISKTVNKSITTSVSTSTTYHFLPGVVWQFQMGFIDDCGQTNVHTLQLVQTLNQASPPCCLPGYFSDPNTAHGACVQGADGKIISLCNSTVQSV
jgi:hypothetical protein